MPKQDKKDEKELPAAVDSAEEKAKHKEAHAIWLAAYIEKISALKKAAAVERLLSVVKPERPVHKDRLTACRDNVLKFLTPPEEK